MGRYENTIFLGLYLLLILLAISSLWWPMGRDQGSFSLGGDIVLGGGVPYRDMWEPKGPAGLCTYALSHLIFGRTLWGIRLLDLVCLAITATFLWRFLFKKAGALAAHTGALFFCFAYLDLGYWHTAQPDGWAGMSLLIALLILPTYGRAGYARLFAAGMLVGLATQYKFIYAVFLFPLIVYDAGVHAKSVYERALRSGTLFAGFLLVNGLSLLWLASNQALDEYISIVFDFNRLVHMKMHSANIKFLHLNLDLRAIFCGYLIRRPLIIPFVITGLLVCWRRFRPFTISVTLFWVTGLALVVAQGWYHAKYQWIPTYGPVAIFLGFGIIALPQYLLGRSKDDRFRELGKKLIPAVSLIIIVVTAYPGCKQFLLTSSYALGKIQAAEYYSHFGQYGRGDFSFLADLQVAEYVRKRSNKNDCVLVWGFEPGIYFLAGRKSATRFCFNYPLVASKGTKFYNRYRSEFMQDVIRNKPLFIVVADMDKNHLILKNSKVFFKEFPEFYSFVRLGYIHKTTIEHFEIFRRRDSRDTEL